MGQPRGSLGSGRKPSAAGGQTLIIPPYPRPLLLDSSSPPTLHFALFGLGGSSFLVSSLVHSPSPPMTGCNKQHDDVDVMTKNHLEDNPLLCEGAILSDQGLCHFFNSTTRILAMPCPGSTSPSLAFFGPTKLSAHPKTCLGPTHHVLAHSLCGGSLQLPPVMGEGSGRKGVVTSEGKLSALLPVPLPPVILVIILRFIVTIIIEDHRGLCQ